MVNAKKSKKTSDKVARATRVKRAARATRREPRDSVVSSVNRLYSKGAPILLFEALLFVVTALVLFVKPVLVLTIFTYIIGLALMLFGLYRMMCGFVATDAGVGGGIDVVFGVINIVLGLLFFVYPSGSLVSVAYICVILFFFKALRVLIFAINLARMRFGHYMIILGVALVMFALAVALFFFPLGAFIAMTYYLAILLLIYAAADVYMFIELARLRHRIA